MSCNFGIHEGLIDLGEVVCPFCDEEISEIAKRNDFCCSKQELIKDNSKTVCKNCGAVVSYGTIDDYIDFYEKCKMMRKSVYHQNYHIKNIVNNMTINGNKMSVQNGLKIFSVQRD